MNDEFPARVRREVLGAPEAVTNSYKKAVPIADAAHRRIDMIRALLNLPLLRHDMSLGETQDNAMLVGHFTASNMTGEKYVIIAGPPTPPSGDPAPPWEQSQGCVQGQTILPWFDHDYAVATLSSDIVFSDNIEADPWTYKLDSGMTIYLRDSFLNQRVGEDVDFTKGSMVISGFTNGCFTYGFGGSAHGETSLHSHDGTDLSEETDELNTVSYGYNFDGFWSRVHDETCPYVGDVLGNSWWLARVWLCPNNTGMVPAQIVEAEYAPIASPYGDIPAGYKDFKQCTTLDDGEGAQIWYQYDQSGHHLYNTTSTIRRGASDLLYWESPSFGVSGPKGKVGMPVKWADVEEIGFLGVPGIVGPAGYWNFFDKTAEGHTPWYGVAAAEASAGKQFPVARIGAWTETHLSGLILSDRLVNDNIQIMVPDPTTAEEHTGLSDSWTMEFDGYGNFTLTGVNTGQAVDAGGNPWFSMGTNAWVYHPVTGVHLLTINIGMWSNGVFLWSAADKITFTTEYLHVKISYVGVEDMLQGDEPTRHIAAILAMKNQAFWFVEGPGSWGVQNTGHVFAADGSYNEDMTKWRQVSDESARFEILVKMPWKAPDTVTYQFGQNEAMMSDRQIFRLMFGNIIYSYR